METRLPTSRGFDEWYGIPRSYTEALWPDMNNTRSIWPSVGSKQGWDPKKKEKISSEEQAPSSPLGSKNAPDAAGSDLGQTATYTAPSGADIKVTVVSFEAFAA